MREAKQLSQQKDRERIERIRFDDVLLQTIPLINEANSISEELQRQTLFALKLVTCWPDVSLLSTPDLTLEDDECAIAESIAADLKVQVNFQESGTFRSVTLDTEQFHTNVYVMREMYQVFIENNRALSAVAAWKDAQDSGCDPFYEPPQPQLIGKSYVFLRSLEFGCKIAETAPIFDHRGLTNGTLKCEITPTVLSHEWQALQHRLVESCLEDYADVHLPTLADFIDLNLRVHIYVNGLRGVPGKLCKDVYVVVKWRDDASKQDEEHASPPAAAPTVDPRIDFSVTLERRITPEFVAFVRNFPLELPVYGIVPISNLNSVASQVIDLVKGDGSSNETATDGIDDSDGSVVFFDVDASGRNKFASKTKAARQRRNGKLLSSEEDTATLLETCREQLAVQGRILAENTQELENKMNKVVRLQQRLDSEKVEQERLRDALESLARANKLLQAKLEQQILKQSVAKFAPDQRKTTGFTADPSAGSSEVMEERRPLAQTSNDLRHSDETQDIDALRLQESPQEPLLQREVLAAAVQWTKLSQTRFQASEATGAVSTRLKQKGLFHAVFSLQHKKKKHGCPVS